MDEITCDIFNTCRFCLNEDDLHSLYKMTEYEFTLEDIEHFTGIKMNEKEQLLDAICDTCSQSLKNAKVLRETAQKNNIAFLQLFSAHLESIKGDPLTVREKHALNAIQLESHVAELFLNENEENFQSNHIDEEEYPASSLVENDENESSASSIELNENFKEKYGSHARGKNKTKSKPANQSKQPENPRDLCNICGRLVYSYKLHMLTHTKEQNFCCPYCPKKFAMKHYRKLHVESMHEKKIIKSCDLCNIGFIHRNSYTDHMLSKHGIGKKYECKICFKTYHRSSHYSDHINKVHGNQEHPCTLCNKVFKSKQLLQGHQSVHSSEQPYACRSCPKRFKRPYARKAHELTHSGIKFSCRLCEKSYSYKTLLSLHYRKDHASEMVSGPDDSTLQ